MRESTKVEKAEAELLALHPDFAEIREKMNFTIGQKINLSGFKMLYTKIQQMPKRHLE